MIQHPSSFLLTFFFVGSIIDPVITPVDPEPIDDDPIIDPVDPVIDPVDPVIDPVIAPVDPEPTEGTNTDPTDTVEPTNDGMVDDGIVDNDQAITTEQTTF